MEEVVYDRLHETAYGDSPLARTILGPVENIRCVMRSTDKPLALHGRGLLP